MIGAAAKDGITKPQIKAIKTLQSKLGLPDEVYRDFLRESFRVDSCTQLSRAQAGRAIEALQQQLEGCPPVNSGLDPEVRIEEWNEMLFGRAAIRGLAIADGSGPPPRKLYRSTGALAWRLAGRLARNGKVDDPEAFIRSVRRDALGEDRHVATAADCRAFRRAVLAALRQRGWYPEPRDMPNKKRR